MRPFHALSHPQHFPPHVPTPLPFSATCLPLHTSIFRLISLEQRNIALIALRDSFIGSRCSCGQRVMADWTVSLWKSLHVIYFHSPVYTEEYSFTFSFCNLMDLKRMTWEVMVMNSIHTVQTPVNHLMLSQIVLFWGFLLCFFNMDNVMSG